MFPNAKLTGIEKIDANVEKHKAKDEVLSKRFAYQRRQGAFDINHALGMNDVKVYFSQWERKLCAPIERFAEQ